MNQKQAETLATIMGGEAWRHNGQWIASLYRDDGRMVVFFGDEVCEYEDDDAFKAGRSTNVILTSSEDVWWVISDKDGNVFYRDPNLEAGWRTQEEAAHEASALYSRTGERYLVREQ